MKMLKAVALLSGLVTANAGAADLSMGSITAAAGQTVTVSVPLRTAGAQISGLQFDVTYDKTLLTVSVAAGSAATAAGKQSSVNDLATGKRILIIGFNQNVFGDGSVADLTITMNASAPVGTYPLTISNAGGTDPSGQTVLLTAVSGSVSVGKLSQTITFGALNNASIGTSSITLSATASSGLPVSFASTTSAVCTVAASVVSILTVGTCSIAASQAGNTSYAPATSVVQSFTVTPASQTITFGSLSNVTLGVTPFSVSATTTSGLPATFTSTTPAVCTISGSTVTILAVGTCSITANQPGNGSYSAAPPITQSFAVTAGCVSASGNTQWFDSVYYTSKPNTAGDLLLVGSMSLSSYGNLSSLQLPRFAGDRFCGRILLAPGYSVEAYIPTPAERTGDFSAFSGLLLDPRTASVGTDGTTTMVPFPGGIIPASRLADPFAWRLISVIPPSVVINAPTTTLNFTSAISGAEAAAQTVAVTTTPSGQSVTVATDVGAPWLTASLSNGTLTVSVAKGSLTPNASGRYYSSTITLSNVGAANVVIPVHFTVNPAQTAQTITFPALSDVTFGVAPFGLSATATSGRAVEFASTTPGVCVFSVSLVSIVGAGTCTITATQPGNATVAAATPVTRSFTVNKASQSISFSAPGNLPVGPTPLALAITSSSGVAIVLTSSTPGTCTASSPNLVTLIAKGQCTLTASLPGDANYAAAAPVAKTFTVIDAPACTYALSPADGTIGTNGGTGNFKVLSGPGCQWTATSNATFIALNSAAAGAGSDTVRYTAGPNATGNRLTGTISVGGQTYTVTQFAVACSFALSVSGLDIPAAGGTATISLIASGSGCPWTASSSDPTKATVAPATGTDSQQVTVTIAANPAASPRALTATIGGQTLNIKQGGTNCIATLGLSTATISAAGGQGTVDITIPAGCTYSTANVPAWMSVTSGATGSGPTSTLFYSVEPNSTRASRTGALSIGGQTFQVIQQGLSCEISLDTSNLGSPFASAGSGGTVGITASNAACSWTATGFPTWLTISPASTGTGSGSLTITAQANTLVTPRSTQVNIGGHGISVSQAGTSCNYSLRSAAGSAPAAGGSGSVGVVAAAGCAWTASSNATWLTLTGTPNSGTADVQFTAQANPGATVRTANLLIAGQTFPVTQAGNSCTFSLGLASAAVPSTGVSSGTVTFTATTTGCAANAVSFSKWITVTTALSGQSGIITYSVTANPGSARTGVVKLGDRTFTVNQASATCSYTLASNGAAFGQAGGTGSIQITAVGTGCTPAISTSLPGAITLGTLAGPVSNVFTQPYTVAAYSSASNAVRVATITIAGKTFSIKQTSW